MPITPLPLVGFLADLICPERCASCDTIVHAHVLFCRSCSAHVRRLGPPECVGCGAPGRTPCERCAHAPSPIQNARAWASYRATEGSSPVSRAIVRFKYGAAPRLGRRLAHAMLTRALDLQVDVVIPVPLHPRRLRTRGYNQSAVLARELARHLDVRVDVTLVTRTRPTPTQVTLSPAARNANVAGAFAVARPDLVRGRSVLLVDDVWTSGATARAVASVLHGAHARTIDVLTFARVL
jgi:ComF family protein